MAVHSIPWEIAPVGPVTKGKSLGQYHKIFTVRDPTTEQTLNIQDYHKEIQDRHIQMHHFLTETTDMNRIGLDVKKQGLTKGTTDNIHQITSKISTMT